jgi:hypothetical protein
MLRAACSAPSTFIAELERSAKIMKSALVLFVFLLCSLMASADSWKDSLSPYMSGSSGGGSGRRLPVSEVKFGSDAHIRISSWLKEHSDVSSPADRAWELMADKPQTEIQHILDHIDLDIVERELTKVIEARRDVFSLQFAHKGVIKEYEAELEISRLLEKRSALVKRIEKYKSKDPK